jgi:hypothetical protein
MELSILASPPTAPGPTGTILGIDGRLSFGNRLVCEHVLVKEAHWSGGHDIVLIESGSYEHSIVLFAPLSSEAIAFIEETRAGTQLNLSLELRVRWQEVAEVSAGSTGLRRVSGPAHWSRPGPNFDPLPLTEWHRILSEMEWQDWQFVELPLEPFLEVPRLADARGHFERARASFRDGKWPEVLAACHSCLEAIAAGEDTDDKRRAFSAFLLQSLPGGEHADKRAKLDELLGALSAFYQMGRHVFPRPYDVSRPEASLALNAAGSMLSLLAAILAETRERATSL